jgi:peptidyl-prolyl cis-trans isomerase D
MLQSMRDNSQGIIAKVLVGLIIVVFALWGVDSLVGLATAEPPPAEVNGKAISQNELYRGIDLQRRQVLTQMGDNADPAMLDDVVLRKVVLDNLIDRNVQISAAEEMGLFVSDQMLDQMIVATREFQVDGRFDRNQFESALRGAGFTPLTYRELLKSEALMNQMRGAYEQSAFMTATELDHLLALNTQTRDIRVARFSVDADSQSVSDAEVQAAYESMGDQLMTQEQVIVDYVVLDQADFVDLDSVTEAEINSAYDQLKASFEGGEERSASHILLEISDAQPLDAALAKAEEIRTKLAAGESFASLASQYSQDIGSANSGGDLGYLTPGLFEGPFDDALFSLNAGEYSEPVETEFGIHIIKLNDVRAKEAPALSEVREDLIYDVAEANAEEAYVGALERLTDLAFSSGDLEVLAQELSLEVLTSQPLTRNGGSGDFSDQKLVRAAFSDVVTKERLNSDPIEIASGRTYVLNMNEFRPARQLELSEVRDDLVSRLKSSQAAEAAMEQAQSARTAAQSGSADLEWDSVKSVARGAAVDLEPQIVEAAFAMARPEGSADYSVVQLSDGTAALITVDAVETSQEQIADELQTQISTMLAAGAGSQAFRTQFETLKSNAEIIIN